jgi:hypothetical protein
VRTKFQFSKVLCRLGQRLKSLCMTLVGGSRCSKMGLLSRKQSGRQVSCRHMLGSFFLLRAATSCQQFVPWPIHKTA